MERFTFFYHAAVLADTQCRLTVQSGRKFLIAVREVVGEWKT
jgi:hypothetical protein